MADRELEFRIRLNGDGTLTGELKSARDAVRDFGKSAQSSSRQASAALSRTRVGVQSISRQLSIAKKQLLGFLGLQQALRGGRAVVAIADDYTLLSARLKLVTDTQEEFTKAQEGTYEIAQQTRTRLGATVDLYQRLARSTKDVIDSQDRLFTLTRAINQAMVVSGATTQEAAAALIQLGQGLRSGVLQGEELRSVLENGGRLAEAIAAGMGVSVGQLRALAKEGKLTTDVVVRAIESQAEAINREFEQMPRTIGGAITEISNAWTRYIGQVDKANSFSRRIADTLHDVAENLDAVVRGVAALAAVGLVVLLRKWALAAAAAVGALALLRKGINLAASAAAGFALGTYFYEQFEAVRGTAVAFVGLLHKIVENTVYFFRTIPLALKAAWLKALKAIRTEVASWAEDVAGVLESIPGVGDSAADAVRAASAALRDGAGAGIQAARAEIAALERDHAAAIARIDATTKRTLGRVLDKPDRGSSLPAPAGGSPIDPAGPDLKALGAAADAQLELLKAKAQAAIAELDRMRELDLVGAEEYFKRRLALEQEAVDAEIANRRRALSTATEAADREQLLGEIRILELRRVELARDADHQILLSRRELTEQLLQLQQRLLQAQGQTGTADLLGLEAEFKATVQRLTAAGDAAGVELAQRLFRTEVARVQLDEMVRQFEAAQARMRDEEARIQLDLDTGLATQAEAAERVVRLHQRTAAELEQQIPLMEELASILGPEAVARVGGFGQAIARLKVPLNAIGQQIKQGFTSAFERAFDRIGEKGAKARDILKGLLSDMVGAIRQQIGRRLAESLTNGLDGLFRGGGGGGGFFSALGSFLSFHTGGIVGHGGARRKVSPLAFVGAPRYHNGNTRKLLGLRPNEKTAVLEDEEEVLTRSNPRHILNQGGGGGQAQPLQIALFDDRNSLSDYLGSPQGQQVMVEAIRRNSGVVRRVLGG